MTSRKTKTIKLTEEQAQQQANDALKRVEELRARAEEGEDVVDELLVAEEAATRATRRIDIARAADQRRAAERLRKAYAELAGRIDDELGPPAKVVADAYERAEDAVREMIEARDEYDSALRDVMNTARGLRKAVPDPPPGWPRAHESGVQWAGGHATQLSKNDLMRSLWLVATEDDQYGHEKGLAPMDNKQPSERVHKFVGNAKALNEDDQQEDDE